MKGYVARGCVRLLWVMAELAQQEGIMSGYVPCGCAWLLWIMPDLAREASTPQMLGLPLRSISKLRRDR